MSDLKQFLDQQRVQAQAATTVNWDRRRDKWLGELDALFERVRGWLQEAGLEPGAVALGTVHMREETLGAYEAPTMTVVLPRSGEVTFTPRGSVIIGGYGRVDVRPRLGHKEAMLIAVDADEKTRPRGDETPSYERTWAWRVFLPGSPRDSYALDDKGLAKLLSFLAS